VIQNYKLKFKALNLELYISAVQSQNRAYVACCLIELILGLGLEWVWSLIPQHFQCGKHQTIRDKQTQAFLSVPGESSSQGRVIFCLSLVNYEGPRGKWAH